MKIEAGKRLMAYSTHTQQQPLIDGTEDPKSGFSIATPDHGGMIYSVDREKELKQQIYDAKRSGDSEYAKELQEELDKLNESKDQQ